MSESRASSHLSNDSSGHPYKILILGAPKVGKTSLMYSFVYGSEGRVDEHADADLISESLEKNMQMVADDVEKTVTVLIQNVPSGIKEPDELKSSFFSGAHAAVFVFSTLDKQSFTDASHWYSTVTEICGNIPVVFVENKIDEIENSVLHKATVEQLAKKHKMRLYRVSAKATHNVEELFNYITAKAMARFADPNQDVRSASSVSNTTCRSYESFETNPDRTSGSDNPETEHPDIKHALIRDLERKGSVLNWTQELEKVAPPDEPEKLVPEKRRTDGVKPVFNKHSKSCNLM